MLELGGILSQMVRVGWQYCKLQEDQPGIKNLNGTSPQCVQQADDVQSYVASKTQLNVMEGVDSHKGGWVEAKFGCIGILGCCQPLAVEAQETNVPVSEPTSPS